jgi:hexosaminidase
VGARVRAVVSATVAAALGVASCLGACGSAAPARPSVVPMADVIPAPVSAHPDPGADFSLTGATVLVSPRGAATTPTDWLAALLRRGTGFSLPVVAPGSHASSRIVVELDGNDPTIGDQGYILEISHTQVLIRANGGEGLFDGAETLRQLLPARIQTAHSPGPWAVEGGQITDYPLYPWRGASLDVARHFFPVSDVERYLDETALYKIDMLHFHLSDDQGWRIAISAYPTLTGVGGSTQVGGGTGGYYTQAQYQQIVAYAASRYINVVPEIDMPGHTNAALASVPQLDCSGQVPPVYTGVDSGISTLCVEKAATSQFVSTVIAELAAETPGPYIDIGGDEDGLISGSAYDAFVSQAARTVVADGKIPVGWADIGTTDDAQGDTATVPAGTITEYWNYPERPS